MQTANTPNSNLSQKLSRARKSLIYIYLASAMGMAAVLFVPIETDGSEPGSSTAFMAFWTLLYIATLPFVSQIAQTLRKSHIFVLIIPLYFIASSAWSLAPTKTLTYGTTLLLNSLFATLLLRWVRPELLFRFILTTCLAMVAASLTLYAAGSDLVIYSDIHERTNIIGGTPLRGLFNHKITAGYYSGLSLFIAWILLRGTKRLLACSTLFIFILLTGSSSALALLLIGALLLFTLSYLKKARASFGLSVLLLGFTPLTLVIAGMNLYEPILTALGRDPTLTGRTLLWAWGIETALEKPILGWGYVGYNGSEVAMAKALQYREFENYSVPHFHNSYIQFLAEFGFIAAPIIIATYFTTAIYFSRRYTETRERHYLLISFSILWIMFSAFFIHTMGRYNDLSMIVFFYAMGLIIKEKISERKQHA